MPYHIDYETWSEADIKKVGGYRYADDPSARILMFAIAGEDGEVACWDHLAPDSRESQRALGMFNHAIKTNDLLYAHNAPFEVAITRYRAQPDLGLIEIPKLDQWRCTAAMCRRAAIPSSLAGAGEMLGLEVQKDKAGKALMEIFSIPGKTTLQAPEHVKIFDKSSKGRRAPNRYTLNPLHGWYDDEGDHSEILWDWLVRVGQEVMTVRDAWEAYKDYCRQDVLTEMALHKRLHKFELVGQELRSFQFNLRLNDRGVPLNLRALQTAQKIVDQYYSREEIRFKNVTGLRPSQGQAFKKWLQERGYMFDNLQAGTVEQALEDFDDLMSTEAVKALQIFSLLNFAALKKITAMLRSACSDGMVRGTLKWHGARTGRATGELVQPQNIKKATLDTTAAYQMLCDGCTLADLEELWDSPLEVIASCARHFIQREGTEFYDADFVGVEARLTPWIAGEQSKLDKILAGVDLYKDLATRIFNVPYEEVTKKQRTIAKPAELGCCIAEGEPVLTMAAGGHIAYLSIEEVTMQHLVWDGVEWVGHEGVKFNGVREVFHYDGIVATGDHEVFVEGEELTVPFARAARESLRLQQTWKPQTFEPYDPRPESKPWKARVYDIINAGPRNRFTVNGKLVHNCFGVGGTGLQKGLGAAPYFVHMSRKECNHIVKVYRDTHPNTVAAWKALEDAAKLAITEGTTSTILNGRVRVGRQKIAGLTYMVLELPSKRRLYYPHAQVKPTWKPYTKEEMQEEPWKAEKGGYWLDQIRFWGERPNNAGWGWIATWGSRLFENIVQAMGADLLDQGCQAAEARGFEVFLIVHDQALCYAHPTLTVKDFEEAFCSVGEWADTFPLDAEAQVVPYYRKD